MREGCYYLKVKIKSLAEEAKIIRRLGQKNRKDIKNKAELQWVNHELAVHRRTVVRSEARVALLVYGFLRGKEFCQIEPNARKQLLDGINGWDWGRLRRLVDKYGAMDFGTWRTRIEDYKAYGAEKEARKLALLKDFEEWRRRAVLFVDNKERVHAGQAPQTYEERYGKPVEEKTLVPPIRPEEPKSILGRIGSLFS